MRKLGQIGVLNGLSACCCHTSGNSGIAAPTESQGGIAMLAEGVEAGPFAHRSNAVDWMRGGD